MPDWFIEDGRADRGPHTGTALKRLAAAGAIDPATPVRREDLASAVPAGRVRGLLAPAPGPEAVIASTRSPAVVLPVLAAADPDAALAAQVGVPTGRSLFAEEPARPAGGTVPAAAPFDPFARRPKPPTPFDPYARAPRPTAPARGTPLAPPRWQHLWPLAALTLGLGWIGGGLLEPDRAYPRGSVAPVIALALAGVPLAWLAFLHWLRPRQVPLGTAVGAAGFTAVGGLMLLLGLQWAAFHSAGVRMGGRGGIVKLVLVLVALAYACTLSDSIGVRFLGYVFGVGLLEEMTKLLPLAWLVHQAIHRRVGLHAFVALGFASGLGFGIGEALLQYNPWSDRPMVGFGDNVVRWFACVPSHGVYTAISAVFLWRLGDPLANAEGFWGKAGVVALAAAAMALLHGIYDTVCSLGTVAALLVEAASLPLLAWTVAAATRGEEDPPAAVADPRLALVQRPRVVGGAFAAAALLIGLAAMGTLDRRQAALLELPPWLVRYVDGQRIEPDAPAPLSARFTLDDPQDPHLIGEWTNTGGEPLVHLVLRVRQPDDDEPTEVAKVDLAPGASHRVAADDWPFDPGEVVEATWEGQSEPIRFALPPAPANRRDDDR